MEMTINIDVEAITKRVTENLHSLQYDEQFCDMVARACGLSEGERRLEEGEHLVDNVAYITEGDLVESLVKALAALRDSNKATEKANWELRKEVRVLKGDV